MGGGEGERRGNELALGCWVSKELLFGPEYPMVPVYNSSK